MNRKESWLSTNKRTPGEQGEQRFPRRYPGSGLEVASSWSVVGARLGFGILGNWSVGASGSFLFCFCSGTVGNTSGDP